MEFISKKYEYLMENDSYYALNKNEDIIANLNVQIQIIKSLFNRYAIKKEKVDPTEMTAEKFFTMVTDISNLYTFDLVKLSKGDVKKIIILIFLIF